MIAGTDAGVAPIKPPDVVRWAIPQLQHVGMTAAEALHACAARAATALGLGHCKGQLRSRVRRRHPRRLCPPHRPHGLIDHALIGYDRPLLDPDAVTVRNARSAATSYI
jgi:hypothetical protein